MDPEVMRSRMNRFHDFDDINERLRMHDMHRMHHRYRMHESEESPEEPEEVITYPPGYLEAIQDDRAQVTIVETPEPKIDHPKIITSTFTSTIASESFATSLIEDSFEESFEHEILHANITQNVYDQESFQNMSEILANATAIPDGFFLIGENTAKTLDGICDAMKNYVMPPLSCIGILLNVLCVLVFMQPRLRGKFYKYLQLNSMFDAMTLSLVAIKPLLQNSLATHLFEIFVFVYISSVTLTCSTMCKAAFAFDRLFRINGKGKAFLRASGRSILTAIVLVSVIVNSPLLFGYRYFDYWFAKQTYFELMLSADGFKSSWGFLLVMNSITIDAGLFLLVTGLNSVLWRELDENRKQISQMILEDQRRIMEKKISDIILKMNDEDSESEAEDDVVEVDYDSPEFNKSARYEPFGAQMKAMEAKREKHTPLSLEQAKQKLGRLAFLNFFFFFFGHIFFSVSSIYQQFISAVFGPLNVFVGYDYYAYLTVFEMFANVILYVSFSLNFFVYYFFNAKFKYTLKRAREKFVSQCCCCFLRRGYKRYKNKEDDE